MAYYVRFIELDKRQALHILEHIHSFEQAAAASIGQVDLGDVPRNHSLRIEPKPRDKHFHLLRCRVLGFIENHERIVQGTSAHERDGSNFDDVLFQIAIDFFWIEHVVQSVIERPQVRVNLVLESARKKSQPLAGFHRRTRQDDTVHTLGQQG